VKLTLIPFFLFVALASCTAKADPACQDITYKDNSYTVCKASARGDLRLFLNRENGARLHSFEAVEAVLADKGEALVFAMNAGMYHDDRSPVGLYIEEGAHMAQLNTAARDGNFGLVPNGVFYIADGWVGVSETSVFAETAPEVDYATQSGPMLVIDGALHPKFNPDGPSKKKRNGVGISEDGETVYFVISTSFVNFHAFASVFRDHLKTPNALFLDGTVSRLYDPSQDRNDPGLPMGPIVGLVGSAP